MNTCANDMENTPFNPNEYKKWTEEEKSSFVSPE